MDWQPALESRQEERALVGCSLWLHVGFVGAAAIAVGLIHLFDGEANWFSALVLVLAGGVLAAMSWRRGRALLEPTPAADRTSAVVRQLPLRSPRSAAVRPEIR